MDENHEQERRNTEAGIVDPWFTEPGNFAWWWEKYAQYEQHEDNDEDEEEAHHFIR